MQRACVTLFLVGLALGIPTRHASAQLLHLWEFDGPSLADRLEDSVSALDLGFAPGQGNVGGVFGTDVDIVFEPGFNGFGSAYRPYYVDASMSSTAGAGLTGAGFVSPNQLTIEAIVKADGKTSGSAVNYIFQTRPGSDRGYYLIQDEDNLGRTAIGGLGSIIGNSFGDVGIAQEYDNDGTWLYIAAVIDLTSNAGQAVADLYAANLSAGETTPTLILDDRTWNSADPSALAGATGIFGIGNFAIDGDGNGTAEASQEWFQGAIDYVAVYSGLLSGGELAANLAGRLIGYPSGDFSGNHAVENADLTLLLNNWSMPASPVPAGWTGFQPTPPAIDNDELTDLLNNWGTTVGAGAQGESPVPEPSAIALLMSAVACSAIGMRTRH